MGSPARSVRLLVHAHTTYSHDGELTPQQVSLEAARRGFGAVLLADHFESLDLDRFARLVEECRGAPGAMLVPGVERTWDGYHVCGLGVSDWVDAPDLESWADRIRAAGGLVSMAHPARYRHRVPARVLKVSDAVEIWNAKRPYDGMLGPHPRAFDLLGAARIGLAAQDVHRWSDFNSVGVVVRDVGSTEDVVAAIRTSSLHLSSALLTVRGRPGRATAIALAGVHAARPVAWALPLRLYRLLRRVRGRFRPRATR